MKIIYCCKDCEERHVGCHSTCERYIQEKEEYNKRKNKEYLEKKKLMDKVVYTGRAVKNMRTKK